MEYIINMRLHMLIFNSDYTVQAFGFTLKMKIPADMWYIMLNMQIFIHQCQIFCFFDVKM